MHLKLSTALHNTKMYMYVASYINSCPRYIRRKSQLDVAPLLNIEATQPLELIHLEY